MLVTADEIFNTSIGNVTFEPGSRNNWHTHPGGQILIATNGTGYFQEKGKPIQVLHDGDVVKILPGVKHWHGASAESEFTHIAVNTNTQRRQEYAKTPRIRNDAKKILLNLFASP
jgi:quercetin dioxygenase-like cupin family protein